MGIYNADGDALYTAYQADGSELPRAYDADGNVIWSHEPISIKVMSYNVGAWTAYGRKATAENQDFWYQIQNSIFDEEKPFFVGIQEYYSAIGSYSVPTMLSQYFANMFEVDRVADSQAGQAMATNGRLTNAQKVNFQNQGSGETRFYIMGDVTVGGKTIKFISGHLHLTTSVIQAEIQELLSVVSNLESWVLMADFNINFPNAESEGYTTLIKPFLDAGYHVANGSTFGFIPTFSTGATDMRYLDNIMCSSNIDITNVYTNQIKWDEVSAGSIDHVPLIAEMTIH